MTDENPPTPPIEEIGEDRVREAEQAAKAHLDSAKAAEANALRTRTKSGQQNR